MFVEMDDKRFFLERIVNENPESKIVVFVRTKVRAERVAAAMERVGIKTVTMHSDKDQGDRLKVMSTFKSGEVKILIATDISARGIDIPDVDFVINYDLPDVPENYVHRVGRTGRGNKKGRAISFCSQEERVILNAVERFLKNDIEVIEVNKADYNDTITLTNESKEDWRYLMKQAEKKSQTIKKKKKK
jgi:ATP-dependent RNA helicase RhlE